MENNNNVITGKDLVKEFGLGRHRVEDYDEMESAMIYISEETIKFVSYSWEDGYNGGWCVDFSVEGCVDTFEVKNKSVANSILSQYRRLSKTEK